MNINHAYEYSSYASDPFTRAETRPFVLFQKFFLLQSLQWPVADFLGKTVFPLTVTKRLVAPKTTAEKSVHISHANINNDYGPLTAIVCSCRETFCCWTSRLSRRRCI